ncbi:MAG: prephenate dehydrogenase/arogenate dehydrogenase family protein [Roseburia sp.]|nr:prephenate dehydrogenase/arogenate dehydrogenase family protein [Roseburia sp.]
MDDLNIGFLGFGLIGGSIARAIKAQYPQTVIQVYSRRKNPDLEKGQKEGVITKIIYDIDAHFSSCDIVFLCAPVLKNIEFLRLLKPFLQENCIITDVGSVKGNIHAAVKDLGMEKHFIGGHPMAGSEKTGYANSSADLLHDSCYLLTPTEAAGESDLRKLLELLRCTGAKCIVLSPEEHDNATAAISHVPHIIAASLVNLVKENDTPEEYMKQFAAGGFKDITRIASSSPEMWENICLANKDSIDFYLAYLIDSLSKFRRLMAEEDSEALRDIFKKAGEYRDSI